jgi:transcriptional regulator with XRE-family HTH domain
MDLKEVMAINLRRLRHAKKMTQEELAESAGLSARYVGAIERADVSASVTVLGPVDVHGRLGIPSGSQIRFKV